MAERKIIDKTGSAAKSEKKLDLGKLNIDFDEIKKLIPSIVSALMTDSKLLKNLKKKPVETMKKIVKKEDLSDNTKNAIKSILKDNKDSDLPTILDKIGDATDGDTSNVFDSLKDLVLFASANTDNLITLAEYVSNMKDGQEYIYYASGKTKDSILSQPQMDAIKSKDYDVLVLTDDVDEFMITILAEYDGKKFKSINSGDIDLLTEEEQKAIDELEETKKPLLEVLQEALEGEVKEVVLSKRLTTSAVCLVSGDGVSFEMERVMNKLPNDYGVKADKILEINPHHEIFKAIETLYESGSDDVAKYAKLLYSQALLIEGIMLENPVEFSNLMCELMVKKV